MPIDEAGIQKYAICTRCIVLHTFVRTDRTIDNYYVCHHDNSKMALKFRDKLNATHLEEHKKTELEKSLKSLSNSVIID